MRKNRFNILNLEEFDDSQVEGQVEESTTPVADAIEDEDNAVELNNEITAFEEYCEENNNAIDAVNELQDQVDAQEEIMENNPEQVTEQTVEVAQEQFYETINKISSLRYYGTSGTISHELSAGTPLERLKVSCEGIKDFIKTVIEKIKAFFKMIKDWLVRILQKFGILKKTEEKTAKLIKSLPDKIEDSKILKAVEEMKQNESTDLDKTIGFYASYGNAKKTIDMLFTDKVLNKCSSVIKNSEIILSGFTKLNNFLNNSSEKDITKENIDKYLDFKGIDTLVGLDEYAPKSILSSHNENEIIEVIKFTHNEIECVIRDLDNPFKIKQTKFNFDEKIDDKLLASITKDVVNNKEKYEKEVLVNKKKTEELYKKHFANIEDKYTKIYGQTEKYMEKLSSYELPKEAMLILNISMNFINKSIMFILTGTALTIFDNINTTARVVKIVSDIANKAADESTDKSKK